MKKIWIVLLLAALLVIAFSFGTILVEDSQPVRIGSKFCTRMFT